MHVNFNRPVFEVCGVVAMRDQTGELVGRALKQGMMYSHGIPEVPILSKEICGW